MTDQFKGIEPMVYESMINIPYSWWAGDTASRFFISLRDEKKIIATRCMTCGKTYLPPRKSCPACFTGDTEWVDVSDEGTLLSFTVARRQFASIPRELKAPVIWGLVKLDGADTALLHYLGDVKPEDVSIGMRVKAVFAEERKGTIRDISHFRPVR
ncbi:MAG: Zn-ribbon domain-containing OB-fold protein [Spirochaetes bacterium]|nr:Zn-ribbon domain-containing OB-fold protein [Spirochaetota bacterium]